eukprot:Gb_38377 [translate_table: standard]
MARVMEKTLMGDGTLVEHRPHVGWLQQDISYLIRKRKAVNPCRLALLMNNDVKLTKIGYLLFQPPHVLQPPSVETPKMKGRSVIQNKNPPGKTTEEIDRKQTLGSVHGVARMTARNLNCYRISCSSSTKDRHTKVLTSKGPRDRRIRLSLETAIKFYEIQDMLGYAQPSKALEWLIHRSRRAIEDLPQVSSIPSQTSPWNLQSNNTGSISSSIQAEQLKSIDCVGNADTLFDLKHQMNSTINPLELSTRKEANILPRSRSRMNARERAPKMTKEKNSTDRNEKPCPHELHSSSVDLLVQPNLFPTAMLFHNSKTYESSQGWMTENLEENGKHLPAIHTHDFSTLKRFSDNDFLNNPLSSQHLLTDLPQDWINFSSCANSISFSDINSTILPLASSCLPCPFVSLTNFNSSYSSDHGFGQSSIFRSYIEDSQPMQINSSNLPVTMTLAFHKAIKFAPVEAMYPMHSWIGSCVQDGIEEDSSRLP